MKKMSLIRKVLNFLILFSLIFSSFNTFALNEENFALKKSVTVSRETSGKDHNKITDGAKNIVSSSKAWNVKASDYIILDLGKNTDFNQIIVYEYSFQRAFNYSWSHSYSYRND